MPSKALIHNINGEEVVYEYISGYTVQVFKIWLDPFRVALAATIQHQMCFLCYHGKQ